MRIEGTRELLLLPENWCLRTGIRVVDPDGWDRKNYLISWQEPITRSEFLKRAGASTCMAWPSPLYDEKWKHEIHEPIKDETVSENQDTPNSNPLLNILNDILKPKSASPAGELMEAAVQLHNMFEVFVKAGFTEAQALELVGKVFKG
jgi:hypothetical protein